MPSKMCKYKQNEGTWRGYVLYQNEEIYYCLDVVQKIWNTVINVKYIRKIAYVIICKLACIKAKWTQFWKLWFSY